ncbi:MAG: flagellar hook-basal body protein [Tissierellaceae bacterium]|jgi:flagellar basal-body rod protein FlgF
MLRSIETINRNMNVLQKKLENTTSNIANLNTPGYKFQDIIQSTLEERQMINHTAGPNLDQRQEVGTFTFGNQIDQVYRNFEQGQLNQTDLPTDLAIVGNGFFVIELDGGLGFTRNGNFSINDAGQLTTMEGYPVLGLNDLNQLTPIYLEGNNFTVNSDGNILDQDLRLALADFTNYQNLETFGDTIFLAEGMDYDLIDGEVKQGFLELSNVNLVELMTSMIEISREFESNQKILNSLDETLRRAANEVGKV